MLNISLNSHEVRSALGFGQSEWYNTNGRNGDVTGNVRMSSASDTESSKGEKSCSKYSFCAGTDVWLARLSTKWQNLEKKNCQGNMVQQIDLQFIFKGDFMLQNRFPSTTILPYVTCLRQSHNQPERNADLHVLYFIYL